MSSWVNKEYIDFIIIYTYIKYGNVKAFYCYFWKENKEDSLDRGGSFSV
jgi:hypothetical protein